MSIIPTMKSRTTRAKIALIPALSLGLFVGSVALAAPAQAHDDDDSIRGCTVTPLKPTDERGNWVNFSIKVECENGKRTVHIRQIRYEADRGSDTRLGDDYFVRHLDGDDHKIIDSLDHVRRNLDRRGSEEVYHKISFAVENSHGNLSDWSDWKKSEVLRDVNVH